MKIALCLSGGLRNFKDTYHTIKHYFLDKYDIDVFFYGTENKEGREQNIKDFTEMYNPKSFVINTNDYYTSNLPCKYQRPNVYWAFYNIMMCNNLKSDWEKQNNFKYDYVVRCRTDYFFYRDIEDFVWESAKTNVVMPIEWAFKHNHDFSRTDLFAIGNSEMMDVYSTTFLHIDEYCRHLPFSGETLTGYHLHVNRITTFEPRCWMIFEYPSPRIEECITPYKFLKYFDEPNIADKVALMRHMADRRMTF